MRDDSRQHEFWTPEPLLDGKPTFLLAGGPSLRGFDASILRGRGAVVAINSSYPLAPWADCLFFTDNNWFDDHRDTVLNWPGLVVTPSRHAKAEAPDKIKRISVVQRPDFKCGERDLKFGRTSGHTAISLAIAMGAVTIVLLGYDMRIADGRSHHHDEYGTRDHKLFDEDFLLHFRGWGEAARRAGVRVINCTPDSALKEFRMADLSETLATL